MKSFPAIPLVAREGGTAPRSRPPDYWSKSFRWHILSLLLIGLLVFPCLAEPDLILHNGKVVSMDTAFSIYEAIAVRDGRIVHLGKTVDVLKERGPRTEVVDLRGQMLIPGLMDSHTHPTDASMTEFDHPIPTMERIRDVLDYIQNRTRVVKEGEWVVVQQVFITRLEEQRFPTRAELDRVAPKHPVMFRTGPDVALNSLALTLSGINRNFKATDGSGGFAEMDPATGEPTGILRNCRQFLKIKDPAPPASPADKARRLTELFADYNSAGLTSVCDRDATPAEIDLYRELRRRGQLTLRVSVSQHMESLGALDEIQANIRRVAQDPLFKERDDWLRIIGIKTYLDGGMLTGSAYMCQPWGVSDIYAIRDPNYRGVLFIPHERLVAMVRAAVESGLQFTAHSVGDGAVHELLAAYAEVNKDLPVRKTRACISHSNFMSREAVDQAARLGVMVDIQPAWLYLDTRTLVKHFGYERLRYFQPLRSLFEAGAVAGGGSDHMQKIGSLRSNNPYNPFLGMATAVTRKAKNYEGRLHPEEALTREQALQLYTINNARVLGCEDQLGSLEPGKLADLVVIDTDLLTCPEEKIAGTQVLRTYVGGKLVWEREVKRTLPPTATEPAPASPDEALAEKFSMAKAAESLDRVSLHWTRQHKCGSCHATFPYLMSRGVLKETPSPALTEVRAFFEGRIAEWDASGRTNEHLHPEVVGIAASLAINDAQTTGKLQPLTRQALDWMWTIQRPDGVWNWTKCNWPPFEKDDYYGAVLAAVGVSLAPQGYAQGESARPGLAKLRKYLQDTPTPSLHHKTWLLWASVKLDGLMPPAVRDATVKELLALQRGDGGWSLESLGQDWVGHGGAKSNRGAPSDGYGTGLVVYVLRQSGVPASDDAMQRGVNWLRTHQRASGRWFTPSLNGVKEHYISDTATAFAVLALRACE